MGSSGSKQHGSPEGGLRTAGQVKSSQPGRPLVTIVTSTMNAAQALVPTIRSVAEQTYANIEHVIIDAASTDGTLQVLQDHSHLVAYWISERDSGIYDAWNKGVRFARGEWIAFVGAGDRLLPDAIEQLLNAAMAAPELDFISGRVDLYQGERFIRSVGRPWRWDISKKYMGVAHPGALHSADYFARYGQFDASLRIVATMKCYCGQAPA